MFQNLTLRIPSLQFLVLSHFKTWHLSIFFLQTVCLCFQIPSDPTQPPCPTLHHIIPLFPCVHISVCATLSFFRLWCWLRSQRAFVSFHISFYYFFSSYWSKSLIFLTSCLSFLGSSWYANIWPTCFVISVVQNFNYPSGRAVKAWICGRSLAGIVGSNPTGDMDVCLLWVLCVVR